MSDTRKEYEAAFWLAWRKGLQFDPRRHLPGFLDDLLAINAALTERAAAEGPRERLGDQAAFTPDEAAKANPAIPERVKPPAAEQAPKPARPPARTATRRRTPPK